MFKIAKVEKSKEQIKESNHLEYIVNTLKEQGFHKNPKITEYQLWKPIKSIDTLYIRIYKDKVRVFILGDFDPYEVQKFGFKELVDKLKDGENIYKILICNIK